jgi:hypothetical protein
MTVVDIRGNIEYQPANHRNPWTVDDTLHLCEMYLDNKTWTAMARELSRTEGACRNRLYIVKTAFKLMQGLTETDTAFLLKVVG